MNSKVKSNLKQKLLDASADFGLPDIIINTYVKQIDHKT